MALFGLVLASVALAAGFAALISWMFSNTIVLFPVVFLLWSVIVYSWRHRWKLRLARHGWLMCLHCAYPLDGLDSESRCPECGRPYTHASTRWGWYVFANHWTEDMDPPPPLPPKA